MKLKNFLLSAVVIAAAAGFTSCKKDSNASASCRHVERSTDARFNYAI